MIDANKAKEIYVKSEYDNAEKWWEEYKKKLNNTIVSCAESRNTTLTISDNDTKLNDYCWISYKPLREKLKLELEKLGYIVSYHNGFEGEWVVIDWS